jgi:antitoxin component HigA of HigAB toxin-antitoxin module
MTKTPTTTAAAAIPPHAAATAAAMAAAATRPASSTPPVLTLRKFLKYSGMKQQQLGKRLGVHQSTVSHWVNGKRGVARKLLRKLSAITGIPVDQLVKIGGGVR